MECVNNSDITYECCLQARKCWQQTKNEFESAMNRILNQGASKRKTFQLQLDELNIVQDSSMILEANDQSGTADLYSYV